MSPYNLGVKKRHKKEKQQTFKFPAKIVILKIQALFQFFPLQYK